MLKKSISKKINPQQIKKWFIAIYIRLSKDDGNNESLSVTNQRKIINEYISTLFEGDYEITDTYIDDGLTGTDYDRPAFQHMIYEVEKGSVNCIIVKNLSRAFRNYSDQGYFLEKIFPMNNTRFISISDPQLDTFLTPDAINGMEIPINGLMNDRFAYKTSSDVRKTLDTKRRNGEFIGAFAPFGYKKSSKNKNKLIIDSDAAQTVTNIFNWYVYGDSSACPLSKEAIAKKLNSLGLPNPTLYKKLKGSNYSNPSTDKNDGLWTGSSVSRILKNKVYIGTIIQGKQKVISYKIHNIINLPEEEW